ncbi:MAG: ribbon-helix-helix domain-containing protein [Aulosira sp. ZfuVER01]|nr:hypothetical protein [Aulosira sp. ZfuVER01]MDZ7999952.1 hypothetical protein [Aulosira sp. DedVER01a]MDZ8051391.1 hypothetical protein [Aulosira sp. ZfuCHP01]
MGKRPSLTSALHKTSGKPQYESQQEPVSGQMRVTNEASTASSVPPSRQGKKAIAGHFDPAVSKQLKQIALDHGTTVQALLTEAMNDLFIKYKRNPIA